MEGSNSNETNEITKKRFDFADKHRIFLDTRNLSNPSYLGYGVYVATCDDAQDEVALFTYRGAGIDSIYLSCCELEALNDYVSKIRRDE
jgi:hypothetical protein